MSDPHMAQLRWRCRRGMRELDMLLLDYVDKVYPQAPREEQATFRRLLATPDPEILNLLTGRSVSDDERTTAIVAKLLERGGA